MRNSRVVKVGTYRRGKSVVRAHTRGNGSGAPVATSTTPKVQAILDSLKKEVGFGTAFDVQDATAEITVGKEKHLWGESQVWRERIENSGDILRELSSRGDKPDPRYLKEKISKVSSWLQSSERNPPDPIPSNIRSVEDFKKSSLRFTNATDGREYLERFHSKVLNKVINQYKNIPTYTKEQKLAKTTTLNLLTNKIGELKNNLKELSKVVEKLEANGSIPIVKDISK